MERDGDLLVADGRLEIDLRRGVLYFHDVSSGQTVLRICRMPEIPVDVQFIDITKPERIAYERNR